MADLTLTQMQESQKELQEKYNHLWKPLCPQNGRDQLLWMMIEAGEMADLIKKKGDQRIMEDPDIRRHFAEEFCDVLMYMSSIMICYDLSPDDIAKIFWQKHKHNMERW